MDVSIKALDTSGCHGCTIYVNVFMKNYVCSAYHFCVDQPWVSRVAFNINCQETLILLASRQILATKSSRSSSSLREKFDPSFLATLLAFCIINLGTGESVVRQFVSAGCTDHTILPMNVSRNNTSTTSLFTIPNVARVQNAPIQFLGVMVPSIVSFLLERLQTSDISC